LDLQLGIHFTNEGTIALPNVKPLDPVENPILNDRNEFEAIGPILKN
jgi:hypothetical protein